MPAEEHPSFRTAHGPAFHGVDATCWCGTPDRRKGCYVHGPQPRERDRPCFRCHRRHWNLDDLCDGCAEITERVCAPMIAALDVDRVIADLEQQFGGAA